MLEIGHIYDDLLCIKFEGKNEYYQNMYLMQCVKCGRTKVSKDYIIQRHKGTTHKACGHYLKTKDPVFYQHWTSMRTRTQNDNYWATDRYKGRGIQSDEFVLFIDFYDKMYTSYLDALKKYGPNISLERKDNNKSYISDNCIWVPYYEQQGNTCRNKMFKAVAPDGTVYTAKNVSKFCREHNLQRAYVSAALNKYKDRTVYKDWQFEYLVD